MRIGLPMMRTSVDQVTRRAHVAGTSAAPHVIIKMVRAQRVHSA